eukprot:PhF_6_TR42179/c0_g1_i1/m.63783
MDEAKEALLARVRQQQRSEPHTITTNTNNIIPSTLPTPADKKKEQAIVEMELTLAAAGPPANHRAVAQEELNDSLDDRRDAHAAFLRAATYKKECEDLIEQLGVLRALCADKEKQAQQLKQENDTLDMKANEIAEKYTNLEKDLLHAKEEQMLSNDIVHSLRSEKNALENEREMLSHRSGVLEQNLKIQDTNIRTLKNLAVNLTSEIETYKTKIDALTREHRLAELKLQESFEKETSTLRADCDSKLNALRKLLDESEEMRQRTAAEWRERELRLEQKMHNELRAKDGEVIELRKRMEELMRQQIETMKGRLDGTIQSGNTTNGFPQHQPVSNAMARAARGSQPVRDLRRETEEVFRDLYFGQRVLSLHVTSSAKEDGAAVSWDGRGPRHHFDPKGRSLKVRLNADPAELSLAPDAVQDVSFVAGEGAERKYDWKFFTKTGAQLNLTLEVVPN